MTIKPVRLRLSRAKGFDLRAISAAVNGLPVINAARPNPWGNPFIVGKHGTRAEVVDLHIMLLAGYYSLGVDDETFAAQKTYRSYATTNARRFAMHNVACSCDHKGPCHADTLLAVFNSWPVQLPNLKPIFEAARFPAPPSMGR